MAAAEVEEILREKHPEILGLAPENENQSPEVGRIIALVKNAILCHMGPSPGFMAQTLKGVNEELARKGDAPILHPEPNDQISKILLAADMKSLASPVGVQKILDLRAAHYLNQDRELCAEQEALGKKLSVPQAALVSAIHSALEAVNMARRICGEKEAKWISSVFDAAKKEEFIYRRGDEETKVIYDQIREAL
jgi:hypothetical protein